MNVYDRVVPNGAMASMIALSIGMGIAVVFDFVIRMVRSRIIDMTGKKLDVIMASNIFEHVLSLKMSQRPASVGIIANQIRDFDGVREFFTSGRRFHHRLALRRRVHRRPVHDRRRARLHPDFHAAGHDDRRFRVAMAARTRHAQAAVGIPAARHGVLVELLAGVETVRATGAEARMQNAWGAFRRRHCPFR